MGDTPKRQLTTRLIHGSQHQPDQVGSIVEPVVFSSAFEHPSAEALEEIFAGRQTGFLYSRIQNPTVAALEERITQTLEARGTLAVASGMTAITLALMALLKNGDELIAGNTLFGGTYTLLNRTLPRMGVETHFVSPLNPEEAQAVVTPNTRAVFLEAISNPAMLVPDFGAWSAFCRQHGIPLLVDATLLSPVHFDAAKLGAAVGIFSSTKYLAGPAATLGGLIVDTGEYDWMADKKLDFGDWRKHAPNVLMAKLRRQYMNDVGPALNPMAAFLQLMGLETLALRMPVHARNAQAVAEYLAGHPKVKRVHYPGQPSHPGHALARGQFGTFGGLLSFELAGKSECFDTLNALKLIKRATNLGDTKTLALHPASTIYAGYWPHELEQVGVSEGMIRLSLGIEDTADLLADLEQALG